MKVFLLRYDLTLLAGLGLVGSVFFAVPAAAQSTSELGGGIGGLNYRGELAPRYRLLNNRPALTVFYRKDISAPITLRAGLMGGALYAADANVQRAGAVIPVAARRRAEMKGSLIELHAAAEYNFLDYYNMKRRTRWTPYFFLGVAGYYASTTTTFNRSISPGAGRREISAGKLSISVPVGVGIKYALSNELNLGLEAGARRTFGDELDNFSDELLPISAQPYDPDWYFYNGISLSYTFYKIRCPKVYDNEGARLLR